MLFDIPVRILAGFFCTVWNCCFMMGKEFGLKLELDQDFVKDCENILFVSFVKGFFHILDCN